jgi:three-Cys-motif partner protein
MSKGGFHDKPFDSGTLTKLDIFETFAREWLPVFLSRSPSPWREVHIFDFFAGPGQDSEGAPGSPIRLLDQLRIASSYVAWSEVTIELHLFDSKMKAVTSLRKRVGEPGVVPPGVTCRVLRREFSEAFEEALPILRRPKAAKLVFIDQFGVDQVDDARFKELIGFSTCDFVFFISSSALHRFRNHPSIKTKIDRPEDPRYVHRTVVNHYRGLIPKGARYFLAPFSIKKGANIWGIIFGSGHPLGIDKFLQVAWMKDELAGEANFDIDRDDAGPLFADLPPTKVADFETNLRELVVQGLVHDEVDVMEICYRHGVTRQHSSPVLKELKDSGVIECSFRVPDVRHIKEPRPVRLRRVN